MDHRSALAGTKDVLAILREAGLIVAIVVVVIWPEAMGKFVQRAQISKVGPFEFHHETKQALTDNSKLQAALNEISSQLNVLKPANGQSAEVSALRQRVEA